MSADPPRCFVAFDLETTGLFPETDRIIEIGAVRFDAAGNVLDRFEALVRPDRPVSPGARAVHGISDEELRAAPRAIDVLPGFVAWLGEASCTPLLAHNAHFDAGFLGRELGRIGHPLPGHAIHDTLDLARRRLPKAPNHRLETVARVLGLTCDRAHRALADSLLVMGVWLALGEGEPPATYRIHDPTLREAVPVGWEHLLPVMARAGTLRIRYRGGTHGPEPRDVTPVRFHHKGGITYLMAVCHRDRFEKAFRLDRVAEHEIVASAGADASASASGPLLA